MSLLLPIPAGSSSHLSSVFLAPGKYTSLPFAASHQEFDLFGIHPLSLLSIRNANRVLKVYPVFVE